MHHGQGIADVLANIDGEVVLSGLGVVLKRVQAACTTGHTNPGTQEHWQKPAGLLQHHICSQKSFTKMILWMQWSM